MVAHAWKGATIVRTLTLRKLGILSSASSTIDGLF